MPFNFPDPAVSTTATNPVTGATYQWKDDPGKWVLTGGAAEKPTPPVTIDLLPPEDPQVGDLWIHAESLIEYAWDGTQWFEVGSSCGGDTSEEEEEEAISIPFVNSYKLVSPDDFTGEAGTAALETDAYANGDDSYLSPAVEIARFASLDLNGRKHESVNIDESFELSPTTYDAIEVSPYAYGKFKVTSTLSNSEYSVEFDSGRAFKFVEGDTIYYRPSFTGDYVKRKGGDDMEGPLYIKQQPGTSSRDTSRINTLGVFSNSQSSYLSLGTSGTKIYVGQEDTSFVKPLKVPELQEKGDGNGIKISSRLDFGQQDTLMKITPDNGTTQIIDLFGSNNTQNLTTLKVNLNGGTYKNAIEFESGTSGSRETVLRIASDKGLKARNLNMDNTKITNLSEPTNDGDATNKKYVDDRDESLRQGIIELEEEIDALAPAVERGFFKSTANNSLPGEGEFMLKTFGGKTIDYGDEAIVLVELSKVDDDGTGHSFTDVEPGQFIQLFEEGAEDFGLYQIESIAGTGGSTTVVTFTVSFVSGFGEATIGDLARLKIFSPPEGGDASGFVLKTGDTMTGNLAIDKSDGSDDVEARLTLTGSRSSKTNAAAAIKFLNDQAQSSSGFLSFRSDGTDTWFTFNRDVDISNQGLQRAGYVEFINNGLIKHNDNDRIKFQSRSTANSGDGLVQFERPGSDGRRGITIRGKHPDDNQETDILWSYTNATGGDAVNYDGKMTADTNLVNKGYVDDNFIKSSGFTDMSASVIVRPAAGEGSNFAVYGGDGTGPNQSIFYVRDADGNTVFRAKNDGKVQAGAGSSTAFMATEDNDLTTKKYVDDEYARLLARIEELENNSGTGGGSGSMSRNIRFTLQSSTNNPGYLPSNAIKKFTAKDDKLYVNAGAVRFKPQGRINITEVNRGDLGPIWSFHITSVKDYTVNNNDEQIIELGVALEGSATTGGSYPSPSSADLYVSLIDGAWDEGATVVSSVSFTTNGSSSDWASDNNPVPNSGKLYKLGVDGNFDTSNYIGGAFVPIDYLEQKTNIKYHGLTDDSSGKIYGSNTDNVVETTVNGVKGLKIWRDVTFYYTNKITFEFYKVLMSYLVND